MLRYDRQVPGLVALYDIRPGNGSGPFLQPGAHMGRYKTNITVQRNCLKCYLSRMDPWMSKGTFLYDLYHRFLCLAAWKVVHEKHTPTVKCNKL